MTEMQKEMQKLISKDELDKAFDARFPKERKNRFQPSRCQPCRKRHCMLFRNPNIEKPLREHVMKTF